MKQNNAKDFSKKSNSNKNNYKGRSNRSNKSNKNGGSPKSDEPKYTNGDINDPSYYYEEPTVLQQVMNFSFNEFGGVPITIDRDQWGNKLSTDNMMVASYWINPSIPETDSSTSYTMDGVTTASLRNFLALSGSNAKTTVYAPQDVTLLTLAVAELIKVSTWLARAFGVAYLFNYRNRSYPETLLGAMNINYDDFNRNLATYRVRYNKLLAMASKIPFPADIPLFRKAADLYAYLYLDDPNSALAQTYMLNPASVWLFDEEYDENGAGLKTLKLVTGDAGETMSDILDRFEHMISALVNSTSLNAIYSDIMRLVQNGKISNLITFKPIDDMFTIAPVYNEEVRDWLHNAMIMGNPLSGSGHYPISGMHFTPDNDVSCDAANNKVKYHPQFLLPMDFGYSGVIDFTHDNPTVEEKVRATRFTQRFTTQVNSEDNKIYTMNLALADEYIVNVYFYDGSTPDTASMYLYNNYANYDNDDITKRRVAQVGFALSKFDWAPLFYWAALDHGSLFIEGDLDYYTVLDYKTVKKIYDYEIIHLLQIG